MPSNHLILCRPLLLLPSIFPSTRVFSKESVLCIRWPRYWNFSFSISPSNEYSGLISFRMDWLDLLAVQGTLKSLLQYHSSKASVLWFLRSGDQKRWKRGIGSCSWKILNVSIWQLKWMAEKIFSTLEKSLKSRTSMVEVDVVCELLVETYLQDESFPLQWPPFRARKENALFSVSLSYRPQNWVIWKNLQHTNNCERNPAEH